MSTQVEKLQSVLSDGLWHSTGEILERVYGNSHLGIARISARIWDLKSKLPSSLTIVSKPDPLHKTLWQYRIEEVKPQPMNYELFR